MFIATLITFAFFFDFLQRKSYKFVSFAILSGGKYVLLILSFFIGSTNVIQVRNFLLHTFFFFFLKSSIQMVENKKSH